MIDSVNMRVNDAFPYSFTFLLLPHRQNMLKFDCDFTYCCLTNVHVKTLCISAFMDHVHSSDDLWRGRKVPLEPIWSHQGMSLYFPLPKSVVIEYIQYQLTLHFFYPRSGHIQNIHSFQLARWFSIATLRITLQR